MSPEIVGAIAGVVGAIAAVIACFQAAAAKRAAMEVNTKIGSVQLHLEQVTSSLTNLTNSPMFHLMGVPINIPGGSGGAGGSASPGGGAGGGGGGSVFGVGGAGGHVGTVE